MGLIKIFGNDDEVKIWISFAIQGGNNMEVLNLSILRKI